MAAAEAGPASAPTRSGGPAALPAFFEFSAPVSWRAIDFISDLHLSDAMPRTFEAWATHLRRTSADMVFILGDLFELWVGDDMRQRSFERHCVEVLAEVASHRQLAFMVGNRDFLVGTELLRAAGMMGLPDPTVLSAWGQRLLLSHGDALCLDDAPYQAFRAEVRAADWQSRFLARPLAERLEVAAQVRNASASRRHYDGDSSVDIDAAAAVRWLHAMGAAEMVHGHTHRPGSQMLAPGYTRHVLSDWDLDTAQRAEVMRLTRDGFVRQPPTA